MKRYTLLLLFLGVFANAQNPSRFDDEVAEIGMKYKALSENGKATLVFTGSSSVRMWKNLQERFPNQQIVNSGFGGSQASDLLFYLDELVLQYKPAKVFIYEGDNDIANFKSKRQILNDFNQIIDKIQSKLNKPEIIIIAAKPSIARWHLRRQYKKLNRKLKKLARQQDNIAYADVWNIMLQKRKVREDIFIEDGLHMNTAGYELWYSVIEQFVN